MSEYTREMIGNCRRWIKDLTDDSVNETLCADEFAGLLDDALDEIERQQARIAELEAENTALKQHPQPIEFWSDEKKELYRRNESRTIKSGREEECDE